MNMESLNDNSTNFEEDYQSFKEKAENTMNQKTQNVYIIIGIDKFIQKLGPRKIEFYEFIDNMKQNKNNSLIIIDTISNIKKYSYEEWYKNNLNNDTAIWVGNGFADQFSIKYNTNIRDIVNNCGKTFGYVVLKGESKLIKLLGMKGES